MLDRVVQSLDSIPEALREHYKETDKGFVLQATEDVERVKSINEFRTNNKKFESDLKEAQAKYAELELKYKELDTVENRERIEKAKSLEGKKTVTVEQMNQHLDAIKSDYESKMQSYIAEQNASRLQVSVADAISKVGVVRQGAMDDVMSRVSRDWKEVDGNLAVVDANGSPVVDSAGIPITVDAYAAKLKESAPHLFESNVGAGVPGSPGRDVPVGTVVNASDQAAMNKIDPKAILEGKQHIALQ